MYVYACIYTYICMYICIYILCIVYAYNIKKGIQSQYIYIHRVDILRVE